MSLGKKTAMHAPFLSHSFSLHVSGSGPDFRLQRRPYPRQFERFGGRVRLDVVGRWPIVPSNTNHRIVTDLTSRSFS